MMSADALHDCPRERPGNSVVNVLRNSLTVCDPDQGPGCASTETVNRAHCMGLIKLGYANAIDTELPEGVDRREHVAFSGATGNRQDELPSPSTGKVTNEVIEFLS